MILPHHFLLAPVAFIINVYIIVSCKGHKVSLQFANSCRNMQKKVTVCTQRGLKEFHLYPGVESVHPTGTVYIFSKDAPIFHFSGGKGTGAQVHAQCHLYLFPPLLLKKQKEKLILEATENQRLCIKARSWRLHLLKSLNNRFLLHALLVLPSRMVGIAGVQHLPAQDLFCMLPQVTCPHTLRLSGSTLDGGRDRAMAATQ